jgi:hypothetical protein
MNEPGLEFVWVGDDAVDPLEQAQTLNILVSAGIKTREEARAELGLGPEGGGAPGKPLAGLGKYNQNHDERGRSSSADGAAGPVGKPERKPQRTPVQVASADNVATDATVDGAAASAQTAPRLAADNEPTIPPHDTGEVLQNQSEPSNPNPNTQTGGERTDTEAFNALVKNPVVKHAVLNAWQDSTADPMYPHENGFYILQDPDSGEISVQLAKRGFAASMSFGPPPASAIAMFHTHPNPPGSPVLDANGSQIIVKGVPQVYNPGPSFEDIQVSNATA